MHPPANQGGDLTPRDDDGRRWHATRPGQTEPDPPRHHPQHPPRLREEAAGRRSAFVRAAEIDALMVFVVALAIGCAWVAAGYGFGVFFLAAAAGALVGLGLIARQHVLDDYRDAAGRLEPHRPWWAR